MFSTKEKEYVSGMVVLLAMGITIGCMGLVMPELCGSNAAFASDPPVSSKNLSFDAIESGLERADWQRLASLLIPSPEEQGSPCDREPRLRLLAGHAFLATGRNNDATMCFACADDTAGSPTLKGWHMWTKDLVRQHPNWQSVRYLYADALARLGLFEDAAFELDQIIAVSPQDFLARNARGIVRWILGAQDSTKTDLQNSAIVDFQVAAQQSGFADAWANLGVLDLYQGYNPDHAKENFNQALTRDSSFALAINGRACALGASGNLEGVRQDLILANSVYSSLPFVVANAVAVTDSADTTSYLGKLAHSDAAGVARGTHWNVGGGFWGGAGFLTGGISGYKKEWTEHTTITERWGQQQMLRTVDRNITERGGLYVLLKEGENLFVDDQGKPHAVGTWFVLNYPILEPEAVVKRGEIE